MPCEPAFHSDLSRSFSLNSKSFLLSRVAMTSSSSLCWFTTSSYSICHLAFSFSKSNIIWVRLASDSLAFFSASPILYLNASLSAWACCWYSWTFLSLSSFSSCSSFLRLASIFWASWAFCSNYYTLSSSSRFPMAFSWVNLLFSSSNRLLLLEDSVCRHWCDSNISLIWFLYLFSTTFIIAFWLYAYLSCALLPLFYNCSKVISNLRYDSIRSLL